MKRNQQKGPGRANARRSPSRVQHRLYHPATQVSGAERYISAIPEDSIQLTISPTSSSSRPAVAGQTSSLIVSSPRPRPGLTHPHPSSRRGQRRSPWPAVAWESTLISTVNLLLTVAAIGGAIRLLPVQLAQHHRLQLLEEQVDNMSVRVSRLQNALDRGMDPEQKDALIKERFNKVPPNHLQVRLVPAPIEASTIASDNESSLQQAHILPVQDSTQASP